MGFYFRKSIRVGPLRFNLSGSGIGVSAGIPGFRVGTGPRGNYVHVGVGGLYYRSTLPSGSTASSEPTQPSIFGHPDTAAPMEEIRSGPVSRMADSSSAALLSELDRKKKRIRAWPLAVVLSVVLLCALGALRASPWIIAPVAVVCLVGVFCAYQFDLLSKTVVILYDFDSAMESAYERLHDSVSELATCGGKWHIAAQGDVYDRKYHAGASQLVKRTRLSVRAGELPYIRTNISTPIILLGARTLCFFPERLLVFASEGVGAVSYDDLSIGVNATRFIEGESLPRDAQVVDTTWQYVNKSGGPDRRFNNNRQLPICLYEELWLNSPSGLNEVIQLSRTGIGQQLNAALKSLAKMIARAPARAGSTLPSSKLKRTTVSTLAADDLKPHEHGRAASPSAEPQEGDRLFRVLLELLCCLMVTDGRASRNAKKRIHEVMTKLHSPWSDSEVGERIAAFIERVQKDGYRKTLAVALKDVELYKRLGKQAVLLRCLDAVAKADGKVTDEKLQLCQRVRAVVE